MEERREKDCPGVCPTLRHVLSPQIPSRTTSHPSPLTFTLHFAFHQRPRLFRILACWGFVSAGSVPCSAAPLSWQSHSPSYRTPQAPSPEVERGLEVKRSIAKMSQVCVTLCLAGPFALPRHPSSSYASPCPHAAFLFSLAPHPQSHSGLHFMALFHRRLLHDIEGNNEMADGERGDKVCSVASGTTSGHLVSSASSVVQIGNCRPWLSQPYRSSLPSHSQIIRGRSINIKVFCSGSRLNCSVI
ncbi:hypothetical protein BT69DRAFT_53071 [Atractiella rhizophila]|nr:hypothetical protein BT69DRAFT_53071 [Atractiella rhizophila]